jgi:hypothetical protein
MNVLSIDIDYAYSPSISSYDEFIEGVRISDEEQSLILETNAIFKPECNPEKLNILKSVVKNNIKKHAEDMLFDLPELKFNIKQVYNIGNLPMFDITFFCISSRWSGLTGKENVMELVKLTL